MKSLKLLLTAIILISTLGAANAQRTVVKVYPKHGTVVKTIHKPKVYVHKGVRFHLAGGIWYKTRGKRYVVCAAPAGIKVRRLPRGHRIVYVGGKRYYKYKGILYVKRGRNFRVVYV